MKEAKEQAWKKCSRYENNSQTLKNFEEICENKRLKILISNTIIIDNVDTVVDKKQSFIQLKWKRLQLIQNAF